MKSLPNVYLHSRQFYDEQSYGPELLSPSAMHLEMANTEDIDCNGGTMASMAPLYTTRCRRYVQLALCYSFIRPPRYIQSAIANTNSPPIANRRHSQRHEKES